MEVQLIEPVGICRLLRAQYVRVEHMKQYLTYMHFTQYSPRTVHTAYYAMAHLFKVAHGKKLKDVHPELAEFFSSLQKKFAKKVLGAEVMHEKEKKVFFRLMNNRASNETEELLALGVMLAYHFMLRVGEVKDLALEDLIVSEQVRDFEFTTYVTINLEKNKSNHYAIQDVSFPLIDDGKPFGVYQVVTRILALRKKFPGRYLLFPKGVTTGAIEKFFNDSIAEFKGLHTAYSKKRWTFHCLRISGICARFAAGCQMDALAILARHSCRQTTMAVYVAKLFHMSTPETGRHKRRKRSERG